MTKRARAGGSALLLALCLGACTNFPDPANRAAVDGAVGAGIGALIGGVVTGGGIGLPIGLGVGAVVGAIAGATTPPGVPEVAGPRFPW
jgi:hypothetical protein